MSRGMRNPGGLKERRCVTIFIEINKYLAVFPRAKISDKNFMTELNEILLNSIPKSWRKQAYVQVFDCEYIT